MVSFNNDIYRRDDMVSSSELPITHSQLVNDFRALGLSPGQVVMIHASVKSVGEVMGGPTVILPALLEVVTSSGTLMMYVGWNDIPADPSTLPPEVRQAYYDQYPAFDPLTARTVRGYGLLAEILRTWPGVYRSQNPEASMVAVGDKASWITKDHPINYGYGLGSPLAKLVELQGQVLMLGAPLDRLTLLHHAENRARLRRKNVIHYQCPIWQQGKKVWVDVEDYATGYAHDDYTFEQIMLAYLAQGKGRQGRVGQAQSYLFDAADLTKFAIHWLEMRFGQDDMLYR
jgi:aminoglycoside 3-N-acetyltransferase